MCSREPLSMYLEEVERGMKQNNREVLASEQEPERKEQEEEQEEQEKKKKKNNNNNTNSKQNLLQDVVEVFVFFNDTIITNNVWMIERSQEIGFCSDGLVVGSLDESFSVDLFDCNELSCRHVQTFEHFSKCSFPYPVSELLKEKRKRRKRGERKKKKRGESDEKEERKKGEDEERR
jgi:hypothetical protein